jgi:hypothetical protein
MKVIAEELQEDGSTGNSFHNPRPEYVKYLKITNRHSSLGVEA